MEIHFSTTLFLETHFGASFRSTIKRTALCRDYTSFRSRFQ
ncbi:hypothetical protein LEP1GSC172_0515 [Leptospira noguchii]|uniref:Uncharacterized protein n=1 Tax=Leptospira noguchii TaxID=28182 RepID=M6W232_9LEPT|nr:hypothetical protein LEP1GSC172_0515 [Leptospira noguchii]